MENEELSLDLNPFYVLGIPCDASDNEIQVQFHRKMQEGVNTEKIIHAYSQVRTQVGRNKIRWETINSHLLTPTEEFEIGKIKNDINIAELIKELAFLSPWELGEEKDD